MFFGGDGAVGVRGIPSFLTKEVSVICERCDTPITATILPWKNDRALHNGYNSAIGEPRPISRDTLGIDLRRSNSNESRTLVTFN